MIRAFPGPIPGLAELLSRHPEVQVETSQDQVALVFQQGPWRREIRVGDATVPTHGLLELCDNNPWVCADVVSVPDPVATLGMIAFGPLARASLLVEPPALLVSFESQGTTLDEYLEGEGWQDGVTVGAQVVDLGSIVAATGMAKVEALPNPEDLDALFDECFGRSFFVHRDEESPWLPELVAGKPGAVYRLRLTEGEPHGILAIEMLADRNGKAGAAQIVHAMNVMAGFEECLGL